MLFALTTAGGCAGNDAISCASNADCLQGSIPGTCLPSPASETHWCGFPDGTCASGLRWGVKSGDDLASNCVAGGGPEADARFDDAATVADAATTPDGGPAPNWSTPALVANIVGPTTTAIEPSASSNGLELFYACISSAHLGDICVASRASTSAQFSPGQPISVLNSDDNELSPDATGDGLELFFERSSQTTATTNIYVSKRLSLAAAWSAPTTVSLSSPVARFPSISNDGLTLYVLVPDCQPACLSQATRATRTSPWGALQAVPLPGALSGYSIVDVSADGLQLLLSGGSSTQASILLAKRPSTSADWATIESIPNLSFNRSNEEPSWGFDDREIYMTSKATPTSPQQIFLSILQ